MTMRETTVTGEVAPGFEPVREALRTLIDRGWDNASSVAAVHLGKLVVRLDGGAAKPEDIQLVASVSKVVESLCIALLVDRGLLRYGDRLVDHWPELSGPGKDAITVRQLMMHRAGLPAFDRPIGRAELENHDARAAFLARQHQEPGLFLPESDSWKDDAAPQAYHAVSRGLYSGELLRRVDPAHRTLGTFFREEIAGPLGLDFWIGLPAEQRARVRPTRLDLAAFGAALGEEQSDDSRFQFEDYEREFIRRLFTDPASLQTRALNCIAIEGVPPNELANHPILSAAELPSSNGIGSALAIARLAALLAGGGELDRQRIFRDPATIRTALETANCYEEDALMLTTVEFTQGGFGRFPGANGGPASYGWGGAGGQLARFVPDLDLGVAYVTDTLGARQAMNDPRALMVFNAAMRCAMGG